VAQKKITSVVFAHKAQQIINEYSPIFGFKTVISVGVELFTNLSTEEKMAWAKRVNVEDLDKKSDSETCDPQELLNRVKKIISNSSSPAKILSESESRLIQQLRELLKPEISEKSKAKNA